MYTRAIMKSGLNMNRRPQSNAKVLAHYLWATRLSYIFVSAILCAKKQFGNAHESLAHFQTADSALFVSQLENCTKSVSPQFIPRYYF
ncbi:hypothetical protein CEXT_143321 [Caerostris extrusa]|uniref:Uncharacterized protein n=1 Tax=Caerostris extrusa TaxID=172846 RepID=A0AAV4QI03_CAEEX|nr:hypothetical protein CEXT_143321 [Caerostris extrusa]